MRFYKSLLLVAVTAATFVGGAAPAAILTVTITRSDSTIADMFTFDAASGVNNAAPGFLFFNLLSSTAGNNAMFIGQYNVGLGAKFPGQNRVQPITFGDIYVQQIWSGTGFALNFAPGQTYTSDTVTNTTLRVSGVSSGVPEPATWAMMVGGFGMMGAAMRRRQRTKVSFA